VAKKKVDPEKSARSRSNRNRGKEAEREIKNILKELLPEYAADLVRNHAASESGGSDLYGIPGWTVEIKYVDDFLINGFWRQVCEDSTPERPSCVIFRKVKLRGWTAYVHLFNLNPTFGVVSYNDPEYVARISIPAVAKLIRRMNGLK